MDSQSPIRKLFTRYAFSADGDRDPIAANEGGADGGASGDGEGGASADAPMSPLRFNQRMRRIAPARGDRFPGDLHDTCMVVERSKNKNLVLNTANLVDAATGEPVCSGKGCAAVINDKDPLRTYWLKLEPEHVARRRARGEMEDICELNYIEKKLAYGCHAARMPADKVISELRAPLKKAGSPLSAEQERIIAEWDAYFHPCVAKYVATPQWPVLMLVLPPLAEHAAQAGSPTTGNASDAATDTYGSPTAAITPEVAASQTIKDVGGDVATAPGFAAKDSVPVMLAVVDGQLSLLKKVYVTSIEPKHFYQLPSVVSLEAFGVSVATGKDTYEKRMNK